MDFRLGTDTAGRAIVTAMACAEARVWLRLASVGQGHRQKL